MRANLAGWLIATTLVGAACHTMAPLSWDEVGGLRPSRVWVTRADQSVVEVSGPQLFGDTLVGYVNGQFQELPTASLQQVVMRRAARGKTIALIAASTAGAAALIVVISGIGSNDDPRFYFDCDDDPLLPECQNP